jgi:post-segregation antitoxin (ccd killing protein)
MFSGNKARCSPARFDRIPKVTSWINVKVPDELAAQAEALGLALEAYVEQILAQQIKEHKAEGQTPRTPKEIRAWLDSLAQFSDKVPPLPEKITREWIYAS